MVNRIYNWLVLSALFLLLGTLPVLAAPEVQQNQTQANDFITYQNELYSFSLAVPQTFSKVERADDDGMTFVAPDHMLEIRVWGEANDGKTIEQCYEAQMIQLAALGEIAYQKKLSDGFSAAWWSGSDSLYLRTIFTQKVILHMVITCDEEHIDQYNGAMAHVDQSFMLMAK